LGTAALGAFFHFLIAFIAAAAYLFASFKLSALVQKAVPIGLAYGVAVYGFMNYLVLPLSQVAPSAFSLGLFLNGIIGHALFVGLPIALCARRAVQSESRQYHFMAGVWPSGD
jgi:uncharacterized membrane protein YagU involved in acid resistance